MYNAVSLDNSISVHTQEGLSQADASSNKCKARVTKANAFKIKLQATNTVYRHKGCHW